MEARREIKLQDREAERAWVMNDPTLAPSLMFEAACAEVPVGTVTEPASISWGAL